MMPPVPSKYHGVWKRKLLSCTSGFRDESTEVFWLQSGSLFADLRLPTSDAAHMDGFAGVTEVVGNQTTWHRDINLKPRGPQEVDAGIMTFSDANHLREDGLDGSYYEDWERLADSTGKTWGFRLKGLNGKQQPGGAPAKGILVGAGDYFIFATDSRSASASNCSEQDSHRATIAFGTISKGMCPWEIIRSTNAAWQGASLLQGMDIPPEEVAEAAKLCEGIHISHHPFGWLYDIGK